MRDRDDDRPFTEKDWRLAVQHWLLTAAINYVQAEPPAAHHPAEMRAVWAAAKREVVASLRAELAEWDEDHATLERDESRARRHRAVRKGRTSP
jgi:hypothetical protein